MKKLNALASIVVALPLLLLWVIVAYFGSLYSAITGNDVILDWVDHLGGVFIDVLDWGWDNS